MTALIPDNIKTRVLLNEPIELQAYYENIQIHMNPNTLDIYLCDPYKKILPKGITFSIPHNYPFVPPTIYVGKFREKSYKTIIQCCAIPKISKLPQYCMRCKFITNDWSPALRMSNIIKYIEKNQKIKEYIKYEIALHRLSRLHHLPEDISILIQSFLCDNIE